MIIIILLVLLHNNVNTVQANKYTDNDQRLLDIYDTDTEIEVSVDSGTKIILLIQLLLAENLCR